MHKRKIINEKNFYWWMYEGDGGKEPPLPKQAILVHELWVKLAYRGSGRFTQYKTVARPLPKFSHAKKKST